MRNVLFLLAALLLAAPAPVRGQRIQSGGYNTTGCVKPDGTVQDSHSASDEERRPIFLER